MVLWSVCRCARLKWRIIKCVWPDGDCAGEWPDQVSLLILGRSVFAALFVSDCAPSDVPLCYISEPQPRHVCVRLRGIES